MVKNLGLKNAPLIFSTTLAISIAIHMKTSTEPSIISIIAHAFFSGLTAYGINYLLIRFLNRGEKSDVARG